jgi:hypothetical protein
MTLWTSDLRIAFAERAPDFVDFRFARPPLLITHYLYQDCNNHAIGCREEVSAPDGNLRRQSIATQIGDTAAFANQVDITSSGT